MDNEMSLAYAAKIMPNEAGFIVTFRDLENVFTEADTYEEALFKAQEVLDMLLLDMVQDNFDIPSPTPRNEEEVSVHVSPEVAAPILLHKLRKEKAYTMGDVARSMGVSYQNYQQMESGKNITLKSLKRAARALGAVVELKFHSSSS